MAYCPEPAKTQDVDCPVCEFGLTEGRPGGFWDVRFPGLAVVRVGCIGVRRRHMQEGKKFCSVGISAVEGFAEAVSRKVRQIENVENLVAALGERIEKLLGRQSSGVLSDDGFLKKNPGKKTRAAEQPGIPGACVKKDVEDFGQRYKTAPTLVFFTEIL